MAESTFNKDLVAFLNELHNPKKTGEANAGQYGYTYPELPNVMLEARKSAAKHHFAIMQDVTSENGSIGVMTILAHESGESAKSSWLYIAAGQGAQANGSAISYARRYSLMAFLGIAGEDDDGAAATEAAKADPPKSKDTISNAQIGMIKALCGNMAMTAEQIDGIKVRHKVEHINELSKSEGSVVITELLERFLDKVGALMDKADMTPDERNALYAKHSLDPMKLDGKALKAVWDDLSERLN